MLDDKDFSLDNEEVSLNTLNGVEQVTPEIITDFEQFEEMSLSVQKESKKALNNLKTKVMLSLDKRKLKEAEKLMSGSEFIADMFSDPEIMARVRGNVSTAMDLKFLSEAFAKMVDSQQKLMRMDSLDGEGTAAQVALSVKFSGGNSVQAIVKAGD